MKSPLPYLSLLFLAQFCLFWQYAKREVVWAYPGGYDQGAYLTADAVLSQEVLHDGPYKALKKYIPESPPTGFMMPLQWNILHCFAGPGRLSNLMLAFGYFVLLQIVFWVTCRHLTGDAAFGWMGIGLLLAQQSAFLPTGGMFDCRIDFYAYNLYGIFVCLLICSDGLRRWRWIAAALASALLMIAFRFITFAYLAGFFVTLVTLLGALRVVWRGRRGTALVLRLATRRTVVLGLTICAVGGSFIAGNWRAIHDYYVVGHFVSKEKSVRAAEMGIKNFTGHLTYYLNSLFHEHLGSVFVGLSLFLLVLGIAGSISSRRSTAGMRDAVRQGRWLVGLLILGASLFAPWFILTLDESKSPVVANVLAPPTALLVVILVARWNQRRKTPWAMWFWRVVAGVVLALGCYNWLDVLARRGTHSAHKGGFEQINALYDCIAADTERLGISAPRIATDMMFDWNTPPTINVGVWERTGRWLAAQIGFGYAVLEPVTREQVFAGFADADVVIISTLPKVGPYPITASLHAMEGEIAPWCEAHLLPIRTFDLEGGKATVYMQPRLTCEGLSGGWITPEGFRLRLPGETLEKKRAAGLHLLIMEGPENPDWLKGVPVANARLDGPGDHPLPAAFTLPRAGVYRIQIDLGTLPAAPSPGGDTVIAVHLDGASFFPPDVGINDPRHLVVMQPTSIRFE